MLICEFVLSEGALTSACTQVSREKGSERGKVGEKELRKRVGER